MSVTKSNKSNIKTITGNGLAVFVDTATDKLTVKDANGKTALLEDFLTVAIPSLEIDDEVDGTKDIDWNYTTLQYRLEGDVVFSDVNFPSFPKTISIHMTGAFAITLPAIYDVVGVEDYDGTKWNLLALDYYNDGSNDIVRGTLTVMNV